MPIGLGAPKLGGVKTSEVIAHFRGRANTAEALGMRVPSVYDWGEYPPPLRQLQVEQLTKGALKAEPDCDKYRVAA